MVAHDDDHNTLHTRTNPIHDPPSIARDRAYIKRTYAPTQLHMDARETTCECLCNLFTRALRPGKLSVCPMASLAAGFDIMSASAAAYLSGAAADAAAWLLGAADAPAVFALPSPPLLAALFSSSFLLLLAALPSPPGCSLPVRARFAAGSSGSASSMAIALVSTGNDITHASKYKSAKNTMHKDTTAKSFVQCCLTNRQVLLTPYKVQLCGLIQHRNDLRVLADVLQRSDVSIEYSSGMEDTWYETM